MPVAPQFIHRRRREVESSACSAATASAASEAATVAISSSAILEFDQIHFTRRLEAETLERLLNPALCVLQT